MSNGSFVHVLCTTSSATNVIGTSYEPVFDAGHGSAAFSNNISDDISWDSAVGTFTFSRDGIYHIVLTLISSQVTSAKVQTVKFNLNSEDPWYEAGAEANHNQDPVQVTHQKIISVSAGDVLHINAKTAGNTMGIEKGTGLSIIEVASGVYASNTVTTNGSNNTTDEFNPYDTDLSGGPAFASANQISNGITVTPTAGSWTVPSAGKYLIMVSNFHGATNSTNSNTTIILKEGSNALWTGAVRNNNNVDPIESTICVIEDLAADAVLTVTFNIASNQVFATVGATFTVYKLNDSDEVRDLTRFISVVNKAALTATAAAVNPFDEDSYSSADFDTRSSNSIVFAQDEGTFTVGEAGLYFVMHSALLSVASDAVITFIIKVNDAIAITANTVKVDSFPDPLSRVVSGILSLSDGDVITVTIDSDGANLGHDAGSSMTIFRIPDWLHKETTPSSLINTDHTINSFTQESLSAQYKRVTEQVPFSLGIPGPMSLRGRPLATTATPVLTKTGDNKS